MSALYQFADRLTVRTTVGEREFADVYTEIADGVLIVSRDSRMLAWFAAGAWVEASFQ